MCFKPVTNSFEITADSEQHAEQEYEHDEDGSEFVIGHAHSIGPQMRPVVTQEMERTVSHLWIDFLSACVRAIRPWCCHAYVMEFKPEVGQSLRFEFAMRVARAFGLMPEDRIRLLEMVKNYDQQRGEFLERYAREESQGRATF